MKKWETTIDNGMEYIEARPESKEVVIYGWTGHWRNEGGNATSFDDFLEGSCQDWIRKQHGEKVLQEVIRYVKEMNSES